MALDGITLAHIVRELRETIQGGRIEKIQQPENDEVIIIVKNGGSKRLLISANAQSPRLHLTDGVKDNPMTAPLFCMVLRKHLTGGRITSVTQGPRFERIVYIDVLSASEMGDLSSKRLVIEIMGKHSNIILLNEGGVILDAVKRVTHDASSVRQVLPGLPYADPPDQGKMDPADCSLDDFKNRLHESSFPVQKHLYMTYNGVSPVTASEIAFRAGVDADAKPEELPDEKINSLCQVMTNLAFSAAARQYQGWLVIDEGGGTIEFAPYPLTMFGSKGQPVTGGISKLLEQFYSGRDKSVRLKQKTQDLRKLLAQNIERCVNKAGIFEKTLRDIENRDTHRLFGELLTANLHEIPFGQPKVTLDNYYDSGTAVTIPLDMRLTPIENAQRYYKRYNKEKRAFEALQTQIVQNTQELEYLQSVLSSVSNAVGEADIREIREELEEQGFARRRAAKKEKPRPSVPISVVTADGFTVTAGKNNKQNDALTAKAADSDIWLHAKGIPGSHVIIKTNGQAVPDETLQTAAELAAYYSGARDGSLVPVDYTLRKYVKKPGGAKPGMVIYKNQKTVFVKPKSYS